ncbi:MAG: 5'/3'-nucleotidase SurE [Desulfobacteraceae bacterium]|nr:5'/3'-nucleotidase SurE [Desulfobacteraceae bacterium]
MENKPLNILLTNDDGIHAPGIWALYRALKSVHRPVVVAPERERSAVSHAITLHKPLRAFKVTLNEGNEGWAVTGTPADCVKLAMLELLDEPPQLVISGINAGANTGVNLNYSGTVAAAKEATLYGVPALATSIQGGDTFDFDGAARFIARLAPKVLAQGLPAGVLLNINFPNRAVDQIAGVRIARQGCDLYDEYIEKRSDPRNRSYYWQGYESQPVYARPDSDGALMEKGYVTLTPVQCDMTDYDTMERLRQWDVEVG